MAGADVTGTPLPGVVSQRLARVAEGAKNLEGLRIGFVGAGRLGTALAWSLAGRGFSVAAAASATRGSAERLVAQIAGCRVASIQEVVDHCNLVFITTPDSMIAGAVAQARWRAGTSAVHCSGVTEVGALATAARDGATTGGFHPMQTFGDPAAAVASLPGCTITIEAEEPLNGTLVGVAERLECRVNRLPEGMRGRYHAAAGYTSQFINALFREASLVWQSWGASEQEAVRALLPMARGTLASIASAGIVAGMPGPVSRGDLQSVEKHLAALAEVDPDIIESYRLLCGRTVALALERGAIDGAMATRIRDLLG